MPDIFNRRTKTSLLVRQGRQNEIANTQTTQVSGRKPIL
jgi:hypothetical protein